MVHFFLGIAKTKSPRKAAAKRPRGKGARGRGKRRTESNESLDEEQNGVANNNVDGDVPELDDPDPPSMATRATPLRNSLRLNPTSDVADSTASGVDSDSEKLDIEEKELSTTIDDDITEILNELGDDLKASNSEVSF